MSLGNITGIQREAGTETRQAFTRLSLRVDEMDGRLSRIIRNNQIVITAADTGLLPASPSVSVGLTTKGGSAATYMRSDAAPPLDQSIAPTWTGAHIWSNTVTFNGVLTATAAATFNADTTVNDPLVIDNSDSTLPALSVTQINSGSANVAEFIRGATTLMEIDSGEAVNLYTASNPALQFRYAQILAYDPSFTGSYTNPFPAFVVQTGAAQDKTGVGAQERAHFDWKAAVAGENAANPATWVAYWRFGSGGGLTNVILKLNKTGGLIRGDGAIYCNSLDTTSVGGGWTFTGNVRLDAGFSATPTLISSTPYAVQTNNWRHVLQAGASVVNLPQISTAQYIQYVFVNDSGGPVTLNANGSETFAATGTSSETLFDNNAYTFTNAAGTEWFTE